MMELIVYDRVKDSCRVITDRLEIVKNIGLPDTSVWLDVEKPTYDDMEILEAKFNFHPLAIEDCMTNIQRPKIDKYIGGYLFIVLHAASLDVHKDKASSREVDVFLGQNFIVTVHMKPIKSVKTSRERCIKNPAVMRQEPAYLFYSLADALVDNYFPILDKLDLDIDSVEQSMYKQHDASQINKILNLKETVLTIRRFIGPQRELVNSIWRGDYSPSIPNDLSVYFRDIADLLAQINDTLDSYRDVLTNLLDGYRTISSNRLNEIMKVLTIITTIMMPLTLISSIYGMNFRHMPELEWKHGYVFALFLMAIVFLGMVTYFKRKKWF